jgi:hypothetical protein
MPFEPTPEAQARWREQLPERITDIFLAQTQSYIDHIDEATPELHAVVEQVSERLLTKLNSALCADPGLREAKKRSYVNARITLDADPAHSDWILLGSSYPQVEGLLVRTLTEKTRNRRQANYYCGACSRHMGAR